MSDFDKICSILASEIMSGELQREDIEQRKLELCSEYSVSKVPKHSDILNAVSVEDRQEVAKVVQGKPTRTISGVSPIAIMTSPKLCPHGKCLYCPGGPASKFSSAQSYTGFEPAAARAEQNDYDPYGQVFLRLDQLRSIGHPVDKVELIVMGGTMTSRSHDYQTWFVKRALQAMNDYDLSRQPNPSQDKSFAKTEEGWEYLEDVISENETNNIRCIGITFETKPDWSGIEQIDRMLSLGGTKVEIGVQTTYEKINQKMHRGHGVVESIEANRRLRDSGFKVGFHMMPGQPGMSKEMNKKDLREIFKNPNWKPDYLKIYPTLVVKGTRLYDMWQRDEFEPLSSNEAAEVLADVLPEVPRYTRIQRIQRDIPADYIEAGVQKSNLRELVQNKLDERGESVNDIRSREVGHSEEDPVDVELDVLEYKVTGGTEYFISFEDFDRDILVGFARLRLPSDPHRTELEDSAIIRELHVYGSEVTIGDSGSGQYQHQGFGEKLMKKAESIAKDNGYDKISVISGIGAREYYKNKLGYYQDGPYVSKEL